ncbi:PDR/VanB family oxidoreductase [Blastococcus sp. SYSU D00820]
MTTGLPSWMIPSDVSVVAATFPMRMAARRTVADDVVELELEPHQGLAPRWEPGAHIQIHLPGGLVRQYSLCGDPDDRDRLTIAVLRKADGQGGSRYLHDEAQVGDSFLVSDPRNQFTLVTAPRYLFIAGGIGITPLRPMLDAVRARGADWTLVYGGRSRASMAYVDSLPADPRVTVLAEDEGQWPDLDMLLAEPGDGTVVYCCGPEGLLRAVEERVASWPPGSLHVERFAAPCIDAPARAFDVVLAQSGKEVHVPADRSVMDVVREAGVSVPSSCRQGTCGTCETMVLEGRPEHRDAILSAEERIAGDCMMICVSRCAGERLVLDL